MRESQFHRRAIGAIVACALLCFVLGRLSDFSTRWGNLKDGMTREEVKRVLGTPTSVGKTMTIGAGNQQVTR